MLVLQRELNERILIGDDVMVEVVGVKGGKVKLGIVAPEGVSIDREEVRRAKAARRGTAPGGGA